MQEIVLFLSSIAGIATAAAIRKFPKNKNQILTIGANSHIKGQINSLNIEKEILTKTISRLYQHDSGLSKIQRDRLLIRYQHQLGIVLAKMEKLETASKHPDLGPVGDGLVALMDQKLSNLDQRLYELTSKIGVVNAEAESAKHKSPQPTQGTKIQTKPQAQKETIKEIQAVPMEIVQTKPRSVEITTLTELPIKVLDFPEFEKQKPTIDLINKQIEKPQNQIEEKIEILQSSVDSTAVEKPKSDLGMSKPEAVLPSIENKPKPTIKLPEEEKIDEGEDDLDTIKREIMKTLSKLEQAEVE